MVVTRSVDATGRSAADTLVVPRALRDESSTSAGTGGAGSARAQVRGLVFEMAGVLYDNTLWRLELFKLLSRLGVQTTYTDLFCGWQRDFLPEVHCGFRQYEEAFHSFLLQLGLSWGQIDEIEAASRIQRPETESGERALPGVTATLANLADQGLRLAVLADAPYGADYLQDKLAHLGLTGRFQTVLSSLDLEAVKPDPKGYRATAAALDLPVESLAFVSCDAVGLAGAAACGMRTIAWNYCEEVTADASLFRFGELVEVVRRWSTDKAAAGCS